MVQCVAQGVYRLLGVAVSMLQNMNYVILFFGLYYLERGDKRSFFASTPFYNLISLKASLMFVLKLLIEKGMQFLYTDAAWIKYSLFL